MIVPGSVNPLLLASAAAAGGLQVSRSLRFNSADSAYLNRTPASAGNRTTWSLSLWVKRSTLSTQQYLFSASDWTSTTTTAFFLYDTLVFYDYQSGAYSTRLDSSQVFRDVAAWQHLVFAWDSNNATSTDRMRIYVNGARITAFSSATYPSSGVQTRWNNNLLHRIGTGNVSDTFDGYLANIHFIDGQALTPASFAETDATTGQWIPKAFSGGSYGTNGFYLQFADNSSNTASTLGKDYSGLGNNWTPVNFVAALVARQGYAGGNSYVYGAGNAGGGGGGGAGAVGSPGVSSVSAGAGGNGRQSSITGSSTYYGGGGGGGSWGTAAGAGGLGGGGAGKLGGTTTGPVNPGTNGLGGGGGAGGYVSADWQTGGAGGSGRVIIRYPSSYGNLSSSGGGSQTTVGSDYVYQWTSVGSVSITFPSSGTIPVQYLVLGGGGGGESSAGGGGGGGGVLEGTLNISSGSSQTVTVGAGGIGGVAYPSAAAAGNGGDSVFSSVTVLGGGRGGGGDSVAAPASGGSGGGGGMQNSSITTGGAGTGTNPADIDSLVDSPTNYGTDTGVGGEVRGNYATLNPLNYGGSISAPTNGNLDVSSGAAYGTAYATIGITSGKWYWEFTNTSTGSNGSCVGISAAGATLSSDAGAYSKGYIYCSGALKANNNSYTSYGASWNTSGDVIGIAYDADNGTLTFYKNGTSQGQAFSGIASTTEPYFPVYADASGSNSGSGSFNFGQRSWAYSAPSGFKALCTQNLPAPLVTKSNTVMDVVLYTGNNSTQSITSLAFNPDMVWSKCRNVGRSHRLSDAIRGSNVDLYTDTTASDNYYGSGSITAFTANGFNLDNSPSSQYNTSGETYVSWCWDAGTSTVTNNSGSISSQVRANATAGFSVISYTGNGSGGSTIGHGLGVAPAFAIFKNRSTSSDWQVYHVSLGNANSILLQSTAAAGGSSAFNSTSPTSTVITLGAGTSLNNNGSNHICYAFAPVVGYSSFGLYNGSGTSDGPFVYTGFRPRFVLAKRTDNTGDWFIWDAARVPYNQNASILWANSSNAETTSSSYGIDFLSNGFKLTGGSSNSNFGTLVYAAFAEMPFNYSRAR